MCEICDKNILKKLKELNAIVPGKSSLSGQLYLTKEHLCYQEGQVFVEYPPPRPPSSEVFSDTFESN